MLVICGGPEGVIVGLEYDTEKHSEAGAESGRSRKKGAEKGSEKGSGPVTQVFKLLCSQGSIKCMSIHSNMLVCGGTDETVQVYNVERRRKHGEIMLPEGVITAVAVHGRLETGFTLVGNEHGEISLFFLRELNFSNAFKGHKREVTGLSVHGEGKSFISTSLDSTLRLWDLVGKTCVFKADLELAPRSVAWSGSKYCLESDSQVLVCDGEDDSLETIATEEKVTSTCWLDELVAVGFKNGAVSLYKGSTLVASAKLHAKRVKSLASRNGVLFSVDSDGVVLCLRLEGDTLTSVWKHEVGFRVNVLVC